MYLKYIPNVLQVPLKKMRKSTMITEWWYHKAIIGTFFSIYILHPSISKYWWEHWYNVEKKTKFTWGIRMLPCSLPYVLTNSYQTTSWCHMTITWQLRAINVHLHVTLVQNYATLEYVICKPTVRWAIWSQIYDWLVMNNGMITFLEEQFISIITTVSQQDCFTQIT